jgi:hypothetical protein
MNKTYRVYCSGHFEKDPTDGLDVWFWDVDTAIVADKRQEELDAVSPKLTKEQAESMLMQYCNIAIIKNDGSDNPNECRLCKDKAKFGIITIPYVIKLLIFYLQAAGINITFRTKEITYPNNRMIEEQFLV